MDNSKLQILMTTIQTGSFSKAAEALNCTQSAVTQAMNSLEKELDIKILNRNHSGITLTPQGEELLPSIVGVINSYDYLSSEAKRISGGLATPIRIGAFSSVSQIWLPEALKEFRKIHPYVNFDIKIGTNILTDGIAKGEIDIAIIDDLRNKTFRFHPLMNDYFYALVPCDMFPDTIKVLEIEEMFDYPFIMTAQNVLEKMLPVIPNNSFIVDADAETTVISMVKAGLGITIIPRFTLIGQDLTGLRVIPVNPRIKRTMGIAVPNSPTAIVSELGRFLKKHIIEMIKENDYGELV